MTDEGLSNLEMVFIESEVSRQLNMDDIINTFSTSQAKETFVTKFASYIYRNSLR